MRSRRPKPSCFLPRDAVMRRNTKPCLTPGKNLAVTPETAADEICTTRAYARRGNDRRLDPGRAARLLRAARQERALGNSAVWCRPGSYRCGMGVYADHFREVAKSRKTVYKLPLPACAAE